jgi:hypothetical protein
MVYSSYVINCNVLKRFDKQNLDSMGEVLVYIVIDLKQNLWFWEGDFEIISAMLYLKMILCFQYKPNSDKCFTENIFQSDSQTLENL